jgi:hypothetical protein
VGPQVGVLPPAAVRMSQERDLAAVFDRRHRKLVDADPTAVRQRLMRNGHRLQHTVPPEAEQAPTLRERRILDPADQSDLVATVDRRRSPACPSTPRRSCGQTLLDPAADDPRILAIRAFNQRLATDPLFTAIIIPMRAGVTAAVFLPSAG